MPSIRGSDDDGILPGADTKPFLAHLEDLRWTIIRCLVALAGGVIICAFLVRPILAALYRPLIQSGHDPKVFLRTLSVVDPFSIHMEIAIFGGLILALPFLLYFIGQFLLPALTGEERKLLGPIFAGGALLFAVGVSFCYFLVLKTTLQFFLSYSDYLGASPMWTREVAGRFRSANARPVLASPSRCPWSSSS